MRGLLLAFLTSEFAGLGAGRSRAGIRATRTTAKTTVKTV